MAKNIKFQDWIFVQGKKVSGKAFMKSMFKQINIMSLIISKFDL